MCICRSLPYALRRGEGVGGRGGVPVRWLFAPVDDQLLCRVQASKSDSLCPTGLRDFGMRGEQARHLAEQCAQAALDNGEGLRWPPGDTSFADFDQVDLSKLIEGVSLYEGNVKVGQHCST